MKKYLLNIFLFAATGLTLSSCTETKLSSESVIKPEGKKQTPFDKWLQVNYVEPYNIEFIWRYDDKETDQLLFLAKYKTVILSPGSFTSRLQCRY